MDARSPHAASANPANAAGLIDSRRGIACWRTASAAGDTSPPEGNRPPLIRAYTDDDAAATARVWHRSGRDEYHYLPAFQALDDSQAFAVFAEQIADRCSIWVYEDEGVIAGFIAMQDDYIDRLYVDPDSQRQGVATALLNHARTVSPAGLRLHTHQQNRRARRFYEHAGFVPVRFGISPAPESVPDVEYHWRPTRSSSG